MKILLIDGSPLMFRVFTGVVRGFTTSAGEPTGLRYGFIRAVRSYEKKVQPDKTVVVWDRFGRSDAMDRSRPLTVREQVVMKQLDDLEKNGRPCERGYKGNRDSSTEEAKQIWGGAYKVQEMLGLTKYTQVWAEGYEADDVIGTLARQLGPQGNDVVIVSPDRDLWQLFQDGKVVGWEPDKKKGVYYGQQRVMEHFGVPAKHLLFWRSWIGDPSDNLKPISKTIASDDFLAKLKRWLVAEQEPLSFDGYLDALPDDLMETVNKAMVGGRLLSNYRLMTLYDPDEVLIVKGISDTVALAGLFEELEMKSLLKTVSDFTAQTAQVKDSL